MRRLFDFFKHDESMKSSSFIKMLQKANIQISTTDADIIFKQFAAKRSMTFEPFV